jgi:hypothetical protein
VHRLRGPNRVIPRHRGIRACRAGRPPAGFGDAGREGTPPKCWESAAPGRRDPLRFHNASTATFWRCPSGTAMAEVPLRKRTPEDGRCPARTGDLLLVRREHLLPSTAVCRSGRSPSDQPHISAAVCCGLPLPSRFHMGRLAPPGTRAFPARRSRAQPLTLLRGVGWPETNIYRGVALNGQVPDLGLVHLERRQGRPRSERDQQPSPTATPNVLRQMRPNRASVDSSAATRVLDPLVAGSWCPHRDRPYTAGVQLAHGCESKVPGRGDWRRSSVATLPPASHRAAASASKQQHRRRARLSCPCRRR